MLLFVLLLHEFRVLLLILLTDPAPVVLIDAAIAALLKRTIVAPKVTAAVSSFFIPSPHLRITVYNVLDPPFVVLR